MAKKSVMKNNGRASAGEESGLKRKRTTMKDEIERRAVVPRRKNIGVIMQGKGNLLFLGMFQAIENLAREFVAGFHCAVQRQDDR